jgi:hypothetical protein
VSTLTTNKLNNRYVFYHKDGLMDLFIGLAIFFAGLFLWTEMVWMAGIFIPVFLPSLQTARKRFLQTRIGNLDRNPRQQAQTQNVLLYATLVLGGLLLALIGILFAFGFMSGLVNEWLRQYFLLMIGIIFTCMWIFAGAMLRIMRFYLYAAFTFGALSLAQLAVIPFWMSLTALGGLIGIVGLIVLIQFMIQHPVRN